MISNSLPLISVITPTYNHAAFIGRCIDSLLQQSYDNWEQVVIDDGSTDNTGDIVKACADPRIHYIHQENQGAFALAETYRTAFAASRGSLVAILEGDDLWPRDKLAAMVQAFSDPEVVLAYGENVDVDTEGNPQTRDTRTARVRKRHSQAVLFNDPVGSATRVLLMADRASLIMPSTVMIRRSAIEAIGGFQSIPGLPLTDYPTFLELSLQGKFHYIPRVLGYRTHHLSSITVAHGEAIYKREWQYALDFVQRHKNRFTFSQADRREMDRTWKKGMGNLRFSQGRVCLANGQWEKARAAFKSAVGWGRPSVALAAVAGYLCGLLRFDLELLIRMSGRVAHKPRWQPGVEH